ncbi:MAG: hypothetical protein WC697_00980 [Patescibacteria group bacterium]|jgi:hypothetical protein
MKKQFAILVFILALFSPIFAYAYSGQSQWDPLYLKIEPTIETKNREKAQELKDRYGISEYYACRSCAGDTSNPSVESTCLTGVQFCLEKKALLKEKGCLGGYIYSNGKCITLDQWCKEQHGQQSYYKTLGNDKWTCSCETGYKWNTGQTACIKKQGLTCPEGTALKNDQCQDVCKIKYGEYSYYARIDDAHYRCDCLTGYKWNPEETQCVNIICPDNSSISSNQCFCNNGYTWNASQTECVAITVAPKSIPVPALVVKKTSTKTPVPILTEKTSPPSTDNTVNQEKSDQQNPKVENKNAPTIEDPKPENIQPNKNNSFTKTNSNFFINTFKSIKNFFGKFFK